MLLHVSSNADIVYMMCWHVTWLVSLFLLVSLSFSLDDLRAGPQKLRLLLSLTGSAMGVTFIYVVVVVADVVVVVGDMMAKVKVKLMIV